MGVKLNCSSQEERLLLAIRAAVGAIALVLFVMALTASMAHAAGARPATVDHRLFERSSLGFSWETLDHVKHRMERAPEFIAELSQLAKRQFRLLGPAGAALRLLLLVMFLLALWARGRISARIERRIAPMAAGLSGSGAIFVSSAAEVVAAVALPLSLWVLYLFVAALTNLYNPAFVVFGVLLFAWTEYQAVTSVARELFLRPLLDIPPEHRRYLYRIVLLLAVYGIFISVLLDSAGKLGALPDAVAFCRWIFELSLIVLLAAAFLRRRAILAVFPKLPNRIYRGFLRGLDSGYPLVFALTLITALLQWAGYRRLALFVWIRTWVVAGLFVGAVFLHQMLRVALRRAILGDSDGSEEARVFYASARRLLDYAGALIVLLLAFNLTGLRAPLTRALRVQLATLGRQPLTPLVLIEATVIVAGFILFAQLVRDYLGYQVYPALNVDPGVAHAIDTFLVYALATIGGLAALEAVGLGVSTLMLFAGAFGIGLGFGLQSLANNLASGITLIFTRSLRRGDIVTVGDTIGVVQDVGIRATRMRTRDDVEYLVPNAEFVGGKIINWTRSNPHARLHVPLGVSYNADPARVRQILEDVAERTSTVEKYPTPEVWFVGFGDSSLNFELLVWMNIRMYSRRKVASDLYFAIFEAFREAGIEIPFPQRDLHIRSAEGLGALAPRKDGAS
jgi:small-conductance mechanosensitive channel